MCFVGEIVNDAIEIIGVGTHPSEGLRKVLYINIEKTVQSIKEAIEELRLWQGVKSSSVYAGIAGGI
jgi:cell division protein FtsA